MKDAAQYGLDRMPAIDASIASLIVSPDEALRPNARCPRPQCRVTDDLLTKSYDIAARMGRIGNSLSHLVLALSQTLQNTGADAQAQGLSDASLQVFAFMTRELGRLMSTLTMARRQVWLAQSPLSEACRKTLRTLPVIPGQMFGPAAQQAFERSVQLGLTVNFAKSCLVPSQRVVFIGVVLDSVMMRASPSPQRVDDIPNLVSRVQK
ncbi:hypothetical protein ABVT39_027118, partial [Epinephelus coioides]